MSSNIDFYASCVAGWNKLLKKQLLWDLLKRPNLWDTNVMTALVPNIQERVVVIWKGWFDTTLSCQINCRMYIK